MTDRGRYDTMFLISTPIQYLMARLIVSAYFPGRHLAVVYRDGHDFRPIFDEIDARFLGPSPFDYMGFDEALASDLPRPKRLFISYRFYRFAVETYYRFKPEILCAYEDGFSLHIDHDYGNKSMHDRNPRYVISDAIKAVARATGLKPSARPKFVRLNRFQEVYSVFPDVVGFKAGTPHFSTRQAFKDNLFKPESDKAGQGECLFLSQPLSNLGMMTDPEYLRLLETILADLSTRYDRVYFKPHPRDGEAVMSVIAGQPKCVPLPEFYSRMPAEFYLGHYPATDVYGFMSSTLFYVPAVFGTKAYTLAPLLDRWPGGNEKLRDYWQAMKPLLTKADVGDYAPEIASR